MVYRKATQGHARYRMSPQVEFEGEEFGEFYRDDGFGDEKREEVKNPIALAVRTVLMLVHSHATRMYRAIVSEQEGLGSCRNSLDYCPVQMVTVVHGGRCDSWVDNLEAFDWLRYIK